jgi:hypothetical protein
MDIPDLNINTGLDKNLEYITPIADVSRYKKLRIFTYSDVIVKIIVEWFISQDGKFVTLTEYRTPSKMHRVELVDIVLPYCRLKIQNQSGSPNTELSVFVMPVGLNKIVDADRSVDTDRGVIDMVPSLIETLGPVVTNIFTEKIMPMVEERLAEKKVEVESLVQPVLSIDQEIRQRSKSPFFNLRNKKKEDVPSASKIPAVDHRIASFVPKGSILYGGDGGRIICLPKGMTNDTLKIGVDGFPQWVSEWSVYPPVTDPTSLALLEKQGILNSERSSARVTFE